MAGLPSVRRMVSQDLASVVEIQAMCYTEVVLESMESLASKLAVSPETCFVACEGEKVVGYLLALPWTSSAPPELNRVNDQAYKEPDCLYLHDLAVSPHARKTGAGQLLVRQFLTTLETFGFSRATLTAVQASQPYWQRYGFCPVTPSDTLKRKLASYGEEAVFMKYGD